MIVAVTMRRHGVRDKNNTSSTNKTVVYLAPAVGIKPARTAPQATAFSGLIGAFQRLAQAAIVDSSFFVSMRSRLNFRH